MKFIYDFLLLEYFLPTERKTRHFKMLPVFLESNLRKITNDVIKIINFIKFLTFPISSIPTATRSEMKIRKLH